MKNKMLILGTSVLLIACGEASFESVPVQSCTIEAGYIQCPDGTSTPVPSDGRDGLPGIDGRDGLDGVDGIDGAPGSIVEVYDPCGDYVHNGNPNSANSHDEVVMIFQDGTILAWFQGVGFTVLMENITYQTTDKDKCSFMVIDGQVVEL